MELDGLPCFTLLVQASIAAVARFLATYASSQPGQAAQPPPVPTSLKTMPAAAACLLAGLHGLLLVLGAAAAALLLGLGANALLLATSADWVSGAPYAAFWLGSWLHWAAERAGRLKPGPIRVAEVATGYVQSQVLFALVNLGLPDLLAARGPSSARELAAASGTAVPPEWLERLLAAAAAFGLVARMRQGRRSSNGSAAAGASAHGGAAAAAGAGGGGNGAASSSKQLDAQAAAAGSSGWLYGLNSVSAALTTASPVSCESLARQLESQYAAFRFLSQGLASATPPFELMSGGVRFWDHLAAHPDEAATFDAAMHAMTHLGGAAAVSGYAWGRCSRVVDVGGGVGGFLAAILTRHGGLRGLLLDQAGQVARAQKVWQAQHAELLPRVTMAAGDMFSAADMTRLCGCSSSSDGDGADSSANGRSNSGNSSSARTCFVLRNILHDHDDAACLKLLRNIRAAIGNSTGCRLLVVEATTVEDTLPCHLAKRRISDMTMMAMFGAAKERGRSEFADLLGSAGFRMARRVRPTNGLFLLVEGVPV